MADWRADQEGVLREVSARLGACPWIVRSSCGREDGTAASNAGAFLSLAGVKECDLARSVEQVIKYYGELHSGDEVLVQPMLREVIRSGVAFTHDPNTCAPYRVVNWTEGGDPPVCHWRR